MTVCYQNLIVVMTMIRRLGTISWSRRTVIKSTYSVSYLSSIIKAVADLYREIPFSQYTASYTVPSQAGAKSG